jgi:hypothetical protein
MCVTAGYILPMEHVQICWNCIFSFFSMYSIIFTLWADEVFHSLYVFGSTFCQPLCVSLQVTYLPWNMFRFADTAYLASLVCILSYLHCELKKCCHSLYVFSRIKSRSVAGAWPALNSSPLSDMPARTTEAWHLCSSFSVPLFTILTYHICFLSTSISIFAPGTHSWSDLSPYPYPNHPQHNFWTAGSAHYRFGGPNLPYFGHPWSSLPPLSITSICRRMRRMFICVWLGRLDRKSMFKVRHAYRLYI